MQELPTKEEAATPVEEEWTVQEYEFQDVSPPSREQSV
jgi:hypothetical protein